MEQATHDAISPRQIAERLLLREGTGQAWGITIEEAGIGHARLSMVLTEAMLNGFGTAHGGIIFALADTAFAYACNSRNIHTVAQSCTINFLDSGRAGERLVAEATEKSLKGRSGVYAVTVKGEDTRVIAEMMGLSRSLGKPTFNDGDET